MGHSSTSSEDDEDCTTRKRRRKLVDKHKKKKKSKESKKSKKKHKKKEKKKRVRHSSSSDYSSSGASFSDSNEEENEDDLWVEAPRKDISSATVSDDKIIHDDDDEDGFRRIFSGEKRKRTSKESTRKAKESNQLTTLDKAGQHDLELNPYWKDGGTGLPPTSDEVKKPDSGPSKIGDGGSDWLRRAFQRAKEEAMETGKSLEEVISNRWGSVERFYSMLENSSQSDSSRERQRPPEKSSKFRKPASSDEEEYDRSYSSSQRRKESEKPRKSYSALPMPQPIIDRKHLEDLGKRTEVTEIKKIAQNEKSPESEEEKEESPQQTLTEAEMNALSARILKAEMLGNQGLVDELRAKLEAARDHQKQHGNTKTKTVTKVVLPETSRKGQRKKQKVVVPEATPSLADMFQSEKLSARMEFDGRTVLKQQVSEYEDGAKDIPAGSSKETVKAVRETLREERMVSHCEWCSGKHRHLVIADTGKIILALPPNRSLTDGHCLLLPKQHVQSASHLDEDAWDEIKRFFSSLTEMWRGSDQAGIFFESAIKLRQDYPHMILHCVPLSNSVAELAPFYFKKSLEESETEWSMNKKLIRLQKGKSPLQGIPKGLDYFWVGFSDSQESMAHVIEDYRMFPPTFGQEIIAGMLEEDVGSWRSRKHQSFQDQRNKVMDFLTTWAQVDFTKQS